MPAPAVLGAICRRSLVHGTACTSALHAGRARGCGIGSLHSWRASAASRKSSSTRPSCERTSMPLVPKKNGTQAIGRSRGGLTTKIHVVVDAIGRLIQGCVSCQPRQLSRHEPIGASRFAGAKPSTNTATSSNASSAESSISGASLHARTSWLSASPHSSAASAPSYAQRKCQQTLAWPAWRASRYCKCACASGHSPAVMLYITVSRMVPSRRAAWPRSTPSFFAPSRSIARCEAKL